MGMFDYVNYKAPCYRCGFELTEWQSKDGDCVMEKVSVEQVRNFYDSCPKCRAWNEFKVVPVKYKILRVELEERK